jgi:hypothetical protein
MPALNIVDGVTRCARYAFGPNRLHLCGPDANKTMFGYMEEGLGHKGLEEILSAFQTMYPYLCTIAYANNIRDPFDDRVVEAYWLGNILLDNVGKSQLHRHLTENLALKKKLKYKSLQILETKIDIGALPHHSFHVFNIWKRTGHAEEYHTLESMDACRVSWGIIKKVDGPWLSVERSPLLLGGHTLSLGNPTLKRITRSLSADMDIDQASVGDIITMHWGVPAEIISRAQAMRLRAYTLKSIALANTFL